MKYLINTLKTGAALASAVLCILPTLTCADIIVSANSADITIKRIKAGHFLTQASMGPTVTEIHQLANQFDKFGETEAYNRWIDIQLGKPNVNVTDLSIEMLAADGIGPSSRPSEVPGMDLATHKARQYGWWHQAVNGNDQLRQRMAWALYQIFVANDNNTRTKWTRTSHYYDMLKENAFGNYRDLLEDVTYHPVMGAFLSSVANDKGDPAAGIFPDENYAREVMQLFSIGVYQVNTSGRPLTEDGVPIENYSNEDIQNLARVFSGLGFDPRSGSMNFFNAIPSNYKDPMIMWEDHHDTGEKVVLGETIPAGQSGDEDISQALDILFNYDTTAPFIARRLIQRFTCSTPHAFYVNSVAKAFENNGSGVRGDFKEVLRAILMHSHARNSLLITQTPLSDGNVLISVSPNPEVPQADRQGRLREPVLQLAHYLRFFEVESYENDMGYFKPPFLSDITSQSISEGITVFNYYNADYTPASGPAANITRSGNPYVLPEFELLPTSAITMVEGIYALSRDGEIDQRATVNSQPAVLTKLLDYSDTDQDKDSFEWLVSQLNLYLCQGTMDEELQNKLIYELDGLTDETQEARFANAIALITTSANYAVTR